MIVRLLSLSNPLYCVNIVDVHHQRLNLSTNFASSVQFAFNSPNQKPLQDRLRVLTTRVLPRERVCGRGFSRVTMAAGEGERIAKTQTHRNSTYGEGAQKVVWDPTEMHAIALNTGAESAPKTRQVGTLPGACASVGKTKRQRACRVQGCNESPLQSKANLCASHARERSVIVNGNPHPVRFCQSYAIPQSDSITTILRSFLVLSSIVSSLWVCLRTTKDHLVSMRAIDCCCFYVVQMDSSFAFLLLLLAVRCSFGSCKDKFVKVFAAKMLFLVCACTCSCKSLHLVQEFDSNKRSCREALEKVRRRSRLNASKRKPADNEDGQNESEQHHSDGQRSADEAVQYEGQQTSTNPRDSSSDRSKPPSKQRCVPTADEAPHATEVSQPHFQPPRFQLASSAATDKQPSSLTSHTALLAQATHHDVHEHEQDRAPRPASSNAPLEEHITGLHSTQASTPLPPPGVPGDAQIETAPPMPTEPWNPLQVPSDTSASDKAPELHTLFAKLDHVSALDLTGDVRCTLLNWLGKLPNDLCSYARNGCVEIIIDVITNRQLENADSMFEMLRTNGICARFCQIDTWSRANKCGEQEPPSADGPFLKSIENIPQLTGTETKLVLEITGLHLGGEDQWAELRLHDGRIFDIPMSGVPPNSTACFLRVPMAYFPSAGSIAVQVVGINSEGEIVRSETSVAILTDSAACYDEICRINNLMEMVIGARRRQLDAFLALLGKGLAGKLSYQVAEKVAETALSFGWQASAEEVAQNVVWTGEEEGVNNANVHALQEVVSQTNI